MTWTGGIIGYALTWLVVELARPIFVLTQLAWAHDLLLFGALLIGPFAISFAAEEWIGEAA